MTLKTFLILTAAIFSAALATAQVEVNMEKIFTVEDKYIDLNDVQTVKDGIVFVGDTRPADKIQEGKYRGMRVQKQRRYYKVNGRAEQFTQSLSFRRAPQGASKDHKVEPTLVPRSCMLQIKPTSDGTLTFCALTNKPEGNNIYVAVVNGTSFRPLATVSVSKAEGDVSRKKASPAPTVMCDYTYTAGDELWIYSDGAVSLHALLFSGLIDKTFTGTDPVAAAKNISKSQK